MKLSERIGGILKSIAGGLTSGRFGCPGERFMTVRELAARYGVSLFSANRIFAEFSYRRLICLDGKSWIASAIRSIGPENISSRLHSPCGRAREKATCQVLFPRKNRL